MAETCPLLTDVQPRRLYQSSARSHGLATSYQNRGPEPTAYSQPYRVFKPRPLGLPNFTYKAVATGQFERMRRFQTYNSL